MLFKLFDKIMKSNIFLSPQEVDVKNLVQLLIDKTLSGEIVWDEYYTTVFNGRKFGMDAPWDSEGLIYCNLYCDDILIAHTNFAEELLNACFKAKDNNRNKMAAQIYKEMDNPPCSMTRNRTETQVICPKPLRLTKS